MIRSILPILLAAAAPASAQFTQLPGKLVGSNAIGAAKQGFSVAMSGDGNTAAVGGYFDNNVLGAVWIYVKSNGAWAQQGPKLVVSGTLGSNSIYAANVALSTDGNTLAIGGYGDNANTGAAWIFTRSGTTWSQHAKLLPGGASSNGTPLMGSSVGLSGDGNTLLAGGMGDNNSGAAWVFTRSGTTWSQLGNKLVPSDAAPGGGSQFGEALAVSADGNTAIIGGLSDNNQAGAAWIFVKSNGAWVQQGSKIRGSGGVETMASQGLGVAISSDGNTAMVGGPGDNNNIGAAWIFKRANGVWGQDGGKLIGTGATGPAGQGFAVALSGDGNTAISGGPYDNNLIGAFWEFKRVNGAWQQQGNKAVATGTTGTQPLAGASYLALSADGSTLIDGIFGDNNYTGAAVIFTAIAPGVPSPSGVTPPSGSGPSQQFTFTFSDTGGYQNLNLLNVLVRDVLDGRHSCYVAFVPSGAAAGSVYLVDDAGDAGGPYSGMQLPGGTSVSNSQCSITAAGSSYSGSGNNATLTLAITFSASFTGNKVVYLAAQDPSSNSGWAPLGVWSNPGLPVLGPSVTSVNTPRATGFTQNYTFTFGDTNGWQDLSVVDVLINSAINGASACYVAIAPSGPNSATVYLIDNAGDAGGPFSGMLLPGSSSVSNSQCIVSGAGSSATGNGTGLQVTLAIQFTQGFTGNQIVYAAARSNSANSGWQAIGTVSVK
jgi:hypothetical protein